MDFTFLPRTIFKNRQSVRYIKSEQKNASSIEKTVYVHDGFYYIGMNTRSIDKLVNIFKRGYASEGVDNAQMELKRTFDNENQVVPEIIFCEGHFEAASLEKFSQFLQNHPGLRSVPFVVNASDISEDELAHFRSA